MYNFQGKSALVTGAGRGMTRAVLLRDIFCLEYGYTQSVKALQVGYGCGLWEVAHRATVLKCRAISPEK